MDKIVAERIKEIRIENKLSQTKFGDFLYVSQDTVSLWENAKSLPNAEQIVEICRRFSVSADYLLGLVD
ncbi:MAG: helix-turn-helix domain-containing protein [Christensenellales bacterium]